MTFELQALQNTILLANPLLETDFERLYQVASDPLIWEQHPNKDRYKRDVFEVFFKGAIESGGALLVHNAWTGEVIGCSRFYDLNESKKQLAIGYTFIGRKYWGSGYNTALKNLMLDHAFQYVDTVIFHIGAMNIRSQKALERIGAVKTGEEEVAYYGEPLKLNFVYEMTKDNWAHLRP